MRSILAALAPLALIAGTAYAQEMAPRAIITKAVQAHGGFDQLAKIRADRVKMKGSLLLGGKPVAFAGEIMVQLPDRYKNTTTLLTDNKNLTLVHIVNGQQVWVTLDGQPQKVDDPALTNMRETMALARAIRLVPLLLDRNYQLTALGESKVGDRAALGVKVSVKGCKDIALFFDKETSLLIKSEHRVDDDKAGKEVTQEEYYSDFRELGGFKRPIKMAVYRKGAKIMEAELLDVKYFDGLPDAEFAKP